MKYLAAIIAFSLGCVAAVALGATTEPADYHKAVIKCGQEVGGGQSFAGTGTVVCRENGGIVLSVAHIFEGSGQCWIDWGKGRRSYARLIGRDPNADLAVLQAQGVPEDVPVIPVAAPSEFAPGGSTVEFIGYGGGNFRHFTANTVGYDPARPGAPILMDFVSISGDSGGPVVFNGKLVAVQWGHDGTHSMGSSCGKIQEFLTQSRVPVCQGGNCYQPQVRPAQPIARPPLAPFPAKPCNCDSAALIARITKLEAEIVRLQGLAVPGPPGPAGPEGKQGPAGPAGVAGKDGQPPAIETIIDAIPPTTFEIWDDGKLVGTRKVKPGGVLPLERYLIGAEKPQ